jgi:chaperone required for assembly of F1-ATPase
VIPVTLGKKTLHVPTKALADALTSETSAIAGKIPPMRSIALTAIEVIGKERETVEEAMMAYVDTDALCYRAENPELNAKQAELLTPIVEWLQTRFDIHIEVTDGLLPIEQSEEVATRLRGYLQSLSAFHLSATLAITQASSSLLLAIAACEAHVDTETVAHAARMEEDFQLERYGADEEALKRREMVVADIEAAMDVLELLK